MSGTAFSAEQFVLEVPKMPPNPNRVRGEHWSQTARRRQELGFEVIAAWARAGRPRARGRRALVHVHFKAPGPPDDLDNRLARCKQLLDQLVVCGALADDSERYLEIGLPTRERGRRGTTTITIRYGP